LCLGILFARRRRQQERRSVKSGFARREAIKLGAYL
jgi:hypothetical protein